ncbi:hypothetical protein ACVIRO_007631 [Rhizobium ruizarguesonis]
MDRNKRSYLQGMLAFSFAISARSPASSAGPLSGTHKITLEEWLAEFATKSSQGTMLLYRFADPVYVLMRTVEWKPDAESPAGLDPVGVPVGFVTDFASVPQIFWSVLPKDGQYTFAAILHDYLYWIQDRTREQCDEILRIVMKEFGVGTTEINAIYWAVRAGGGSAWDENTSMRGNGERRLLKRLPTKPQITWETWKKEPGVFEG